MSTDSMELTDFMASYPSIDEPNIQELITAKWEFNQLASNPDDVTPNESGKFNHQELIERILRVYNRQICLHNTGTGKSFLIGILGEAERVVYNGRGIKGVIVVVKGKTQLVDVMRTLICKSTKGHYLTEGILTGTTERSMKTNTSRSLRKWYDIVTYSVFGKKIAEMSDEALRVMYSDYLIIMDEFHNTRIIDERSKKAKFGDSNIGELSPHDNVTYQMWRLSHIPQRIKVVGLSASLMINSVKEAIITLNIILPKERQIPSDVDLKTITTEELAKYVRGYISYVRSPDTHIFKNRLSMAEPTVQTDSNGDTYASQLIIHPLQMSAFQTKLYAEAYKIDLEGGKRFKPNSRQASLGVYPPSDRFPNGSYGNDGFYEFFEKDETTGHYKIKRDKQFLKNYFTEANLRGISVTAYEAIKICREAKGVVVIFDELVDGSGLNYLAVAMDNMGFKHHDASRSVFVPKSGSGPPPYCGGTVDRVLRPGFELHNKVDYIRYLMITKDTPNSHLSNILEIAGSDENKDAGIVKVFMISGRGKEGISINNMTTFIEYSGVWTPTAEYQAESRGIRATSHIPMFKEMVQRMMTVGMTPQEIEIARIKGAPPEILATLHNPVSREVAEKWGYIPVDMYKFATFPHSKIIDPDTGNPYPSTDLLLYRYVENKDRKFKQFMRKLKQNAIDCWIHHERNIRPNDIDGTDDCDYGPCVYTCVDPLPKAIDFTTSDVYYIKDIIEKINPAIQEYFRKNGYGTIDSIKQSIDPENTNLYAKKKYIQLALTESIINRQAISDRFGYYVYIREDNGVYYIVRDFPITDVVSDDRSSSFYGSTYVIERRENISKTLTSLESTDLDNVIAKLKKIDPNNINALDVAIKKESNGTQVLLLETLLKKYVDGSRDVFTTNVLYTFRRVIFSLNEPREQIQEESAKLAKEKMTEAKRKKKTERIKFDDETSKIMGNGELVYIHSLYSHAKSRTDYNVIVKIVKAEGVIRIFKPSENEWRDTNEYERRVYNRYIQSVIDGWRKEMDSRFSIYGIMADEEYRIRNTLPEKEKSKAKDDIRNINDGRICSSFTHTQLTTFLWIIDNGENQLLPYDVRGEPPPVNEMKSDVIRFLNVEPHVVNEWTNQKIQFFWLWSISKLKKKNICSIIKEETQKRGQILYLR